MRIQRFDGCHFTIEFVGYQFPEETDYWDGNWLQVAVSAKHPDGWWHATDPSLLTFEAVEFAGWLEALAGAGTGSRIRFTEPNLSFESVVVDGGTAIRVFFELESRPAWAKSIPSDEFWIDFPCSEQDLRGAATALRQHLERFPVRGTAEAD